MTVISVCHHNHLRYSLHRQRLCLTALHALSLHLETSKTQIKCSCKFFYEKLSKCSDTKRGWTGSKVQSPEPRFQSWILDPQFLKVSVSTYVVLFIIRKSMRSSFISGLFHFLNFLIFFIFFYETKLFLTLMRESTLDLSLSLWKRESLRTDKFTKNKFICSYKSNCSYSNAN